MSTGTGAKRAVIPITDVPPDPTEAQELHDRIEQRAYQIYQERGGEQGQALEDWLRAEREILGEGMDADLG